MAIQTSLLPLRCRQLSCIPWTSCLWAHCSIWPHTSPSCHTSPPLSHPSFCTELLSSRAPWCTLEFGLSIQIALASSYSAVSHLCSFAPVSSCLESVCLPYLLGTFAWSLQYSKGAPSLGSLPSASRAPPALSTASCSLLGTPTSEHTIVFVYVASLKGI